MVLPVSAAWPMETTKRGRHHRSHDRSLKSFVWTIIAGRHVTIVRKSQPAQLFSPKVETNLSTTFTQIFPIDFKMICHNNHLHGNSIIKKYLHVADFVSDDESRSQSFISTLNTFKFEQSIQIKMKFHLSTIKLNKNCKKNTLVNSCGRDHKRRPPERIRTVRPGRNESTRRRYREAIRPLRHDAIGPHSMRWHFPVISLNSPRAPKKFQTSQRKFIKFI